MAETTQINKFRQKRLRTLTSKKQLTDKEPINNYFYPKNNLYTRQEFELLDSIYSDEPPGAIQAKQEIILEENFWPQGKEEYLIASSQRNNLFTKLTWLFVGVMIASVIWLIYFQVSVHAIKTKQDTQIVFQKSAQILTDKTADKKITKDLNTSIPQHVSTSKNPWTKWFTFKGKQKAVPVPQVVQATVKSHTISNGDSLWIIANKYYSNPSPENIKKIMDANNMKKIGLLSVGQKIVIPN